MLVGAAAMFDLRLLGVSRALPVNQLARHLLPWSAAGLGLVVITGLTMFSAHATEFWTNPAFLVKMTLIVLAGLNALAFHAGVYRGVSGWNAGVAAPAAARVAALASLLLWVGVISCGRLLAYL